MQQNDTLTKFQDTFSNEFTKEALTDILLAVVSSNDFILRSPTERVNMVHFIQDLEKMLLTTQTSLLPARPQSTP
jgi:hypothetical protein